MELLSFKLQNDTSPSSDLEASTYNLFDILD